MKKTVIKIGAVVLVILVAFFAISEMAEARYPSPAGYVNDTAGVMSGETKAGLESLLSHIEEKTTAEMVVLTVKTTAPLTIEQYAVEVYKEWGIGKKGKDNGVLLLVAVDDRKVRIEVGYGLEGAITDMHSKIIINDMIVPSFKKGDYSLGIASGIVTLAKILREEYGVEFDMASVKAASMPMRGRKRSPAGNLLTLLFFILIFGFRFGALFFLMGSGGGGYWSGGSRGSFGGGFGGFGGGMSGGGGASGSW